MELQIDNHKSANPEESFLNYSIGVLMWYAEDKGYGVIACFGEGGGCKDVFLHESKWIDKKSPNTSDLLVFSIVNKNREEAINCRRFNNSVDDWNLYKKYANYDTVIKYKNKRDYYNFSIFENLLYSQKDYLDNNNLYVYVQSILEQNPQQTQQIFQNLFSLYKRVHYQNLLDVLIRCDKDKLFITVDQRIDLIKSGCLKVSGSIDKADYDKLISQIELRRLWELLQNESESDIIYELVIAVLKSIKLSKYDIYQLIDICSIINLPTDINLQKNIYNYIKDNLFDSVCAVYKSYIYSINLDDEETYIKYNQNYQGILPLIDILELYDAIKAMNQELINSQTDSSAILSLYRHNLIYNNFDYLLEHYKYIDTNDMKLLVSENIISEDMLKQIVSILFEQKEDILTLVKFISCIDDKEFVDNIDNLIFNNYNECEYFKIWELGLGHHLPINFIYEYIDDDDSKYKSKGLFDKWIQKNLITPESFKEILDEKILRLSNIYTPVSIETIYNIIRYEKLNYEIEISEFKVSPNELCSLVLWISGQSDECNKELIFNYLDSDKRKYSQNGNGIFKVSNWKVQEEKLRDLIINKIQTIINYKDRDDFLTLYYLVYLMSSDVASRMVKKFNNSTLNNMLWVLNREDKFDFDVIKRDFLYYESGEQVIIIKKLFLLKSIGKFDLTIDMLKEIVHCDISSYKNNIDKSSATFLDLSTSVIIECLISLKERGEILVESDLFKLVFNNIGDSTQRFKISNYFDCCTGRTLPDFSKKKKLGDIYYLDLGNHSGFYVIIYNNESEKNIDRDKFYNMINAIKSIPQSKYINENNESFLKKIPCLNETFNSILSGGKFWVAPLSSKQSVWKFAQEYMFMFRLGRKENTYIERDINFHLANLYKVTRSTYSLYKTAKVSNEYKDFSYYCDGYKKHKKYKLEHDLYWCCGHPCYEAPIHKHSAQEWMNYTLYDFICILGLDVSEQTSKGLKCEMGKYVKFVHQINRFNKLLDRLYCKKCGHILYPEEVSNYSAENVTEFSCRNESCSEYGKVVYLNHCLNPQCNGIIDSRESKKCPNGWYICPECASCCSNYVLTKRLRILKKMGGYISDNLVDASEYKIGHNDKSEYFCYKCGNPLELIYVDGDAYYRCKDCGINYKVESLSSLYKKPEHLKEHLQICGFIG